jgi:hypothetical protein
MLPADSPAPTALCLDLAGLDRDAALDRPVIGCIPLGAMQVAAR